MLRYLSMVFLALGFVSTSGGSEIVVPPSPSEATEKAESAFENVKEGDTKDAVLSKAGEPTSIAAHQQSTDEIWHYRGAHINVDVIFEGDTVKFVDAMIR